MGAWRSAWLDLADRLRVEADSLDGGGWDMSGTTLGAFTMLHAAWKRFKATLIESAVRRG